ncbi:hypothetical protein POL68_38215 [Stigmatella sp. ncwal1]|uniref:Uncharacterized protein n=1 Tax=Stigmatella ashevillensis TaxID=2995309 RepID=A0ABT5DL69_9BACT|nr:hypothetical protein [Stigmatella ashevillena]MDC0714353.1 hypothetical protein [Stigmatella ashevillena]
MRGSRQNDEGPSAPAGAVVQSDGTPPQSSTSRAFDLVYTSGGGRDCDKEHIECFRRCWNTQPPYPITRGDKGHDKYCARTCREAYMECLKDIEAQPLAFSDMVKAKDWLKRHEKEVLVGSIVLVAGAAFMVSTVGAGVLVLVPLAAL